MDLKKITFVEWKLVDVKSHGGDTMKSERQVYTSVVNEIDVVGLEFTCREG